MKKVFLSLFTIMFAVLMFANTATVHASEVQIKLDGELVSFDVTPFIQGGRTMVPIRAIADMLDIDVEWDADNRTIAYTNHENVRFILTVGYENAAFGPDHDDMQTMYLDAPPTIVNDRTFVPLRFIAESLGVDVDFVDGVVHISQAAPYLRVTVWRAGIIDSDIYHSVNNCGNMHHEHAIPLTRGQAHSEDMRACLRCW